MGGSPSLPMKPEAVTIRLTRSEKAGLVAGARREGLTITNYVRQLIAQDLGRHLLATSPADDAA